MNNTIANGFSKNWSIGFAIRGRQIGSKILRICCLTSAFSQRSRTYIFFNEYKSHLSRASSTSLLYYCIILRYLPFHLAMENSVGSFGSLTYHLKKVRYSRNAKSTGNIRLVGFCGTKQRHVATLCNEIAGHDRAIRVRSKFLSS